MPPLHLVLGPVGAGKSTFAHALQAELCAVRFDLDAWMAQLYRPDERPADRMAWYLERTRRCLDQIWSVTLQLAACETPVVLELGLIRRGDREAFYARVDEASLSVVVHLVDAPRDVRRTRVIARNIERGETWSMHVPPEIFELASDLWEPPDALERSQRDVRQVDHEGGEGV